MNIVVQHNLLFIDCQLVLPSNQDKFYIIYSCGLLRDKYEKQAVQTAEET